MNINATGQKYGSLTFTFVSLFCKTVSIDYRVTIVGYDVNDIAFLRDYLFV